MEFKKKRTRRYWMGGFAILVFLSAAVPHLISVSPARASVAQDDAVEFAISEIKRLDILWTPVFYVSTESVYRFAAPIAMSGGGYILLQSPKMVVDIVSGGLSGGLIAGLVKLVDGIQLDFILYIIEACVKTPKHVCRGLVKDTIDEGWAEYKRAYEIVRDYKRTGSLTREQALEFLRCRYGPDKLALAKTLRERIATADYSISRTAAEEATKDIMSRFSTSYQDKLGIDDKLPLVASAMFIKEIEEILRSKKAGLPAYVPYQRFSSEIEEIFRRIIDERERFEGIKAKPVSISRPAVGYKPAGSDAGSLAVEKQMQAEEPRRAAEPTAVQVWREPLTGMEFVWIQAGEFKMGSNAAYPPDENPAHRVRITRGFWLGKYEVTQGQWRAIMGSNPSYFRKGDNYPVTEVSWNDAQEFIKRLNSKTGLKFRLPTEAEWEYACRAGTSGETYGDIEVVAWCDSNSEGSNQPVGRKQPNAFGLYDMLGNVYEWVEDWYDPGYYGRSPVDDPRGSYSEEDWRTPSRVMRGGSWFSDMGDVRAAYRGANTMSYGFGYCGFRLARTN